MSSTIFSKEIEPKIFFINGPPGSGKDTAGIHLARKYASGQVYKFAQPIKDAVVAIYHKGNKAAFDALDTYENKGIPQAVYFGKTCREVQIAVSEFFLKPFHGDQAVFGKFLARDIRAEMSHARVSLFPGPRFFFITDSGFRPEAEELVREFGADNCFLLRIRREGYTYAGDSRDYINLRDLGVAERDVINDYLPNYLALLEAFVDERMKP